MKIKFNNSLNKTVKFYLETPEIEYENKGTQTDKNTQKNAIIVEAERRINQMNEALGKGT